MYVDWSQNSPTWIYACKPYGTGDQTWSYLNRKQRHYETPGWTNSFLHAHVASNAIALMTPLLRPIHAQTVPGTLCKRLQTPLNTRMAGSCTNVQGVGPMHERAVQRVALRFRNSLEQCIVKKQPPDNQHICCSIRPDGLPSENRDLAGRLQRQLHP